MIIKWVWLLALVGEVRRARSASPGPAKYTEAEASGFMKRLNIETASWMNRLGNAQWDYDSNLTDYNLQKQLKVSAESAVFTKDQWEEVIKYPWKTFKDPSLRRQFKAYSTLGTAALPEPKRARFDELVAKMTDIYSTTKLVKWEDRETGASPNNTEDGTMQLEPDLVNFFSDHANDSCRLQYYWEGWFSSVGRKEKPLFEEYANISNEAAKLNNFTDVSAYWNDDFEMDDFDDAVHKLYLQILPLYQHLHAYVRGRLAQRHNTEQYTLIENNGCLPAHILGNIWAQDWNNVYKITAPFPGKASVDVTPTMKAKNFTPLKMFQMAEEFYTSINMSAMTDTFWKKSIIEKQKDREMVCHGSAWDFANGDDFRIKMCTRVNLEDFKTVHHEMGHVEYFMQYKNQPYVFRTGANSGFHEAVGDTIALSVSTAKHLIKVGLLDPKIYKNDNETNINSLYTMALEKVVLLPFAYVLDLWRWELFRGNITSTEFNCRYWQLRQELGGIVPPVDRSANDFDPAAKYHVIANVPYIRYFVSNIIQFQFHKALCIKAGQYDPKNPASKPLHHCDIYQSKEAGNLFRKMLQMGASKPPQEAMEVITGQREIDAGPLLEYFKPLLDWLTRENQRTGETIGWSASAKITCSDNGEVHTNTKKKATDDKCRYVFSDNKPQKDNEKKQQEN